MGFFERLKEVLQGGEAKQPLHLTPVSALEQLESLSDKMKRGLDEKLIALFERFEHESGKTRGNITKLEQGTLINKDVETRHLQIMEGNRTAYIRKVEQFLDAVDEATPRDKGKAHRTADYLRERLESLLKSTQKSYFVLQEFLANESRNLASNLKAFDKLISELQKLQESQEEQFSRMETVRAQLAGVGRQPEREDGLRKSAEKAEVSAAAAEQAQNIFKRSTRHRELATLRKQQENLRTECESTIDALAQSLSVIGRAMKKYLKMSAEPEIVSAVLDSSERVLLLEPKRLKQLLPRLERAITSGEVSLKDKKRKRSLEMIQQLNEELPGLAERFKKADSRLSETEENLGENAAVSEEKRLLVKVKESAVRARMAGESLNTYLKSRDEKPERDSETLDILEKELTGLFGCGVRLQLQQNGASDHKI